MKKIVKIILSFVMVISFVNIQSVKAIEQLQVNDQVMINDEEELKIHEDSEIDQNHLLKGISLSLDDDAYTISYQVKENGIWSDVLSNGEVLSFNQMTSLKVILDTTDYDLSYRIYNETNQWSDWFKSNEEACFEDDSIIENYEVKVEEAKKESVEVSTQTSQETQIATYTEPRFSLVYNAHVANIGWQKEGDAISFQMGTTGRALGLEAVRLAVDTNLSGSIQYRAHVANIGWQSWVNNNEMAGTTGRAYSIEALQFQLTGELANQYDIYYRAHVSDYGWLGWTSNGNIAGSTGKAKKLEAIEIKIVRKGESGPTVSSSAYKYDVKYNYRGHSSDIGWLSTVGNNAYVGTTGRNKALEAFTLNVSNPVYAGAIQYQAYVANSGWQSWVSNGQTAGTTGKGLALNAVKIQLTGEISKYFDVYYRAHVSDIGWLGWTKNGEIAGAIGYGKKVEAIQVYVVEKGVNPYRIGGSYRYNEAPKISNVQISNVNSAGYTITCTVEDSDGMSKVLFPTWSVRNGQDDIVWKSGTISGNKASFHVNIADHNYDYGNYITHIYAYDKYNTGSAYAVGTVNTDAGGYIVNNQYTNINYYSQKDSRWSNKTVGGYNFGSTGCVPTVASMLVNTINNKNYLPIDMGQILHNAGYYNVNGAGTKSNVWSYVAMKHNLNCTSNLNFESLVKKLQDGEIVVGTVEGGKFCPWYDETHEIMFFGLDAEGYTYVHDPYTPSRNGRAKLIDIYNNRSTYWGDCLNGGPFYSFTKK